MDLMTWNPLREIDVLLSRAGLGPLRSMDNEGWMPMVDVRETDAAYVVSAELPGIAKEDIKVVDNGVLTLQGERHRDEEEKNEKYYRRERSFGRFSRSFSLPESVAADEITAKYREGIMEIRLPKTERQSAHRTEVPIE